MASMISEMPFEAPTAIIQYPIKLPGLDLIDSGPQPRNHRDPEDVADPQQTDETLGCEYRRHERRAGQESRENTGNFRREYADL